MFDKRALIVLNPYAGRGRAGKVAGSFPPTARRHGWEVDLRLTEEAGHEVELGAAAAAEGWPIVLAVGGDGTVHGVANGLLGHGASKTILAHVPIGTGNDFAGTLGLDKRSGFQRNLDLVLQGTPRTLDVGRVMGEYFVNSCGLGFGPEVVRRTLGVTWLSGFPLYLAAVIRSFYSFEPTHFRVSASEHEQDGRILMLEAAVGRSTGGGFKITPDADATDGLLDVCVIREIGKLTFVRSLSRVLRGTHGELDAVNIFRSAKIEVESRETPVAVHLDGELRYSEDATVTVESVPGYLQALCVEPTGLSEPR